MFRPSSRILSKLLSNMTSIRFLLKRTMPILSLLEPLHRPLPIQSPRFFTSNREKSSQFKEIGTSNAFEIGSTKFIFNILEGKSRKEIILAINEIDKATYQQKRHIWLSMIAAKILFERLEAKRLSIVDRKSAESRINVSITKFVDNERQYSIDLKLVRDRIGDIHLKIELRNLFENKGTAIFVPLDGISNFQEKLSAMIRNYEKLNEHNQPKAFEDLCKTSFFFGPKRYFLDLHMSKLGSEIMMSLCEYNREGKKRTICIPIELTRTLFSLLKDAYEFIQSHEGRLSSRKLPREVVYENSFTNQVTEYTVQVVVSEPKMRILGDMILSIKEQSLDNESQMSIIIIRSHGAWLLLEHFEKILQEYNGLRPVSSYAEATKPSIISDKQRRQMLNQELVAWKAEAEAALAELQPQNWMGSEEDRQKEFPKRKEKFAKKLEEIYKKYSNLV